MLTLGGKTKLGFMLTQPGGEVAHPCKVRKG